jgi:uncharacterized membrane protein YjjB (DUF3815 family)
MIIQIISAFVGSIGFAIFFKMKGKQIPFAGLGGAVTWAVYLAVQMQFEGYFIPYLLASIFVALYAEAMARVNKAPATIFLTATAVPLIPGGSLYYTMAGLVNSDHELFVTSGKAALIIALAISLGFVLEAILARYYRMFREKIVK